MQVSKTARLFFIILVEGYVVLATELLAIRQLIPFVGSGTETVAIIISAVLLPLALGYHVGGRQRAGVRKRLLRNSLTALMVLAFGLSSIFLELFFALLTAAGVQNQILQTAVYSLLFLSPSVFLLGQTVPLVSNYFGRARINEITGRMLFFSTVGSFLGSIFSTLVLMNIVGVHITVIVTATLLFMLVPLLTRRLLAYETVMALLFLGVAIGLNSPASQRSMGIVSNNRYNTISVEKNKTYGRVLKMNHMPASGLGEQNERTFPYIHYIEEIFINPIKTPSLPSRDMLMLGAGGFTVGLDDTHNQYTFVDIDPALKDVAEKHFIGHALTPNKAFVAGSARAFVHKTDKKFDFILVDTYTHIQSVPMETTTEEFLKDTRKLLKPGGILVVNQVASPDFKDKFSVRYDHVFANVFGIYTRQVIGEYNPWIDTPGTQGFRNVLYIYQDRPYNTDTGTYTDDKNTYSFDRY